VLTAIALFVIAALGMFSAAFANGFQV